jgi:uncharacterized protein YqfA (UPF0365 family)
VIGYVLTTDWPLVAIILVLLAVVFVYVGFTLWVLGLLEDARREME